jgi:hypothetical protein
MKKVAAAVLFFFCIVVFSATPPAFARHGVTAREASAGDMEDMRKFLLHLAEHRELVRNAASPDDKQIEFRNALRTDNGVWRHGDTYVITVNKRGEGTGPATEPGDTVFFHAKYPSAVSGSLRGIQVFEGLMTDVEQADGEPVCVPDDRAGKQGRHICAAEDYEVTESGARNSFIQVVGFDHERREADLSRAKEVCPEFTSDELRDRGWLSADMVGDEESLVRYLEGVVAHVSEEIGNAPGQSGNGAREEISVLRMVQLMPCWREWPWESGSIYFYIVTDTDKMFGIFNGNTPQLQDRTLRLRDDNGVEIAERILEEVREADDTPDRGFLTYLWDDPTRRGDEVVCEEAGPVPGPVSENEEVFCDAGNPIPGRSTGTSVKRGYFIRTNFGAGDTYYVVGSGIYPRPQGGGGGCAIAPGSGNELRVGTLSLFLIAAVLFLATSRGRRPGAKLLAWDLRACRKER